MEGVTIIETGKLNELIAGIETLKITTLTAIKELKESKKPYLNVAETMELTGFSKAWVNNNKAKIGFCSVEGSIRFKRSDVESFMNNRYFKSK